jgi:UDP-N-acetylmuramoylalanine--D-glutamate ligase
MMVAEDNNWYPGSRSTTVIVGLGKTGLSCARFLAARGEPFVVVDSRKEPPYVKQLLSIAPNAECYFGKFDSFIFDQAKRLIVSPGVSVKETLISDAAAQGAEVVGDIALFAEYAEAPIVAITGSNGKSTVTSLLGEMAKASHVNAIVGGNIGTPALELLSGLDQVTSEVSGNKQQARPDYYVLELSSFQLETTPHLRAHSAVTLNISEDHMDRYSNLQEYINAKRNVYNQCKHIVFNRDDLRVERMVAELGSGSADSIVSVGLNKAPTEKDYGVMQVDDEDWLVKGSQKIISANKLSLPGRHNLFNALAAMALAETMNIDMEAMKTVLQTFVGLPHRMQLVATVNDVQWFNDSKGTNVGATVSAISGMSGSKILIAGGEGKGADFEPLREAVIANNVRLVILIGRDAELIEKVISGVVKTERAKSLPEAVKLANTQAKPLEKVILSPACASFDMFNDYQHRGDVFMDAVRSLRL